MNIHCLKIFIIFFNIFSSYFPLSISLVLNHRLMKICYGRHRSWTCKEKCPSLLPLISIESISVCLDWFGETKCGFSGLCHLQKQWILPHYWSPWSAINTTLKLYVKLLLKYHKSVHKCVYYSKPQIWFCGTWRNNIIGVLCNICHLSIYYLYNVCIISSSSFLQWVLIILIYPHPTPTRTRSILHFSTQLTWWFFFTVILYCSNIIGYAIFRWHVMNFPGATLLEETLSSLLAY